MGFSVDLGSISASVVLDLEGLSSGLDQATRLIKGLGGNLQEDLGAVVSGIGGMMTGVGVAITGALGAAVKAGGDFEQMMQQTAANTTMTTADIQVMNDTVRKLGSESAAPLKQLAEGFMHASNFGFSAADSAKILDTAMRSAVATGGHTGKTTELLAQVMHQFHISTADAAKTMNVLHLAAANGNMTLEQFVSAGGKSITTAHNYGFSLVDVTSALSALTRNGFNAATASTQVVGMMVKITNPAAAARKQLAGLSRITGIDLVRDFSVAGAAARGLPGIMDDIAEAARRAHLPIAEVMNRLVPASRGGIGLTALIGGNLDEVRKAGREGGMSSSEIAALKGNARDDFDSIRKDQVKASKGQIDPTAEGYAKSQQNLKNALQQFDNQMTLLGADIEKVLKPALLPLLEWVKNAIEMFEHLPDSVKQAGVVFMALAGAAMAVAGPVLMLVGAFMQLLPAIEAAGPVLAAVGTALTGPVGLAIAAVVAAVALLTAAWVNDWGHIREHTQAFVSWIQPYLTAAWNGIVSVTSAAWTQIKDFIAEIWPPIQTIISTAWGIISGVVGGALQLIGDIIRFNFNDIKEFFSNIWTAISGVFKVAWAVIAGIVSVAAHAIVGDWKGVNEAFVKYSEMAGNGLLDIFKGIFTALAHLLQGVMLSMVEAGRHIVEGLANGIKAGGSAVMQSMKEVADGCVIMAKEQLGIHSPSTVFHEVGNNMSLGMANGIVYGTDTHVKKALGHQQAEHKKHLKQLQKDAEEAASALAEVYDKIFEMTHSESDVKRRDANKQYRERLDANDSPEMKRAAARERDLTLAKIAAEEQTAAWEKQKEAWEKQNDRQQEAAKRQKALDKDIQEGMQGFADWKAQEAEEEAKRQKTAAQDEMRLHEAIYEAQRRDLEAIKTLQEDIYADAVKANKEQLQRDTWEAEVAASDRKSKEEQKKSPNYRAPLNDAQQALQNALKQMQDGVQGILGGAFDKLFHGDTKKLFADMLKSFEDLLAQMVAKALAAGIANLLFGGAGGFLGGKGGGGFLGAFGFDDATNDKKANRWGFDFARHFGEGASDFKTRHGGNAGQGRAAGDTHVHLNIGEVHNHTQADMGKMAEQLAWHVQTGLSGRFVGGNG